MSGSFCLPTPRLTLRALAPDDLPWLTRLHADPVVMQYIRPVQTAAETARRLAELLAEAQAQPGLGLFPAQRLADQAIIGWFVLTPLEQTGEIQVGYRLFPEYWGQGYATEGSRALLRYGFTRRELPRIVGVTHQDNAASQRVLQKAGLVREGIRTHYNMEVVYFRRERATWLAAASS